MLGNEKCCSIEVASRRSASLIEPLPPTIDGTRRTSPFDGWHQWSGQNRAIEPASIKAAQMPCCGHPAAERELKCTANHPASMEIPVCTVIIVQIWVLFGQNVLGIYHVTFGSPQARIARSRKQPLL